MRVPADEEIVLVAGHAPVRAKKLKYYEDSNFTSRILPPPELSTETYRDRPPARDDDWSLRPVPKMHLSSSRPPAIGSFDEEGGLQHRLSLDEPLAREWAGETDRLPLDESASTLDTRRSVEDQELKRLARMAAMDPNDGIAL